MTALAVRALAFAERYGITIAVVAGDRLSWRSQGPTPGGALKALKAAKGELIDLLVRFRLDSAGGLAGDHVLGRLQAEGFTVHRYGDNAALDDSLRGALARVPPTSLLYAFADKQAEYGLALRVLRAPDCFKEVTSGPCEESDGISAGRDGASRDQSAATRARELLDRLRSLGFRAKLEAGALYLADTTGWQRDLSRFISPALVFEVLNAGLDDDPALLDPKAST